MLGQFKPAPPDDIPLTEATSRLHEEFNDLNLVRQGLQMLGRRKMITPKVTKS